jgi:hypothetical protein
MATTSVIRNNKDPVRQTTLRMVEQPYYLDYNPLSIPGCELWLDAADTATLTTSGQTVTGWADKSQTGKTVTVSSSPSLSGISQNAYQTIAFNNNLLTTTLPSAIRTNDYALVAVWKQYTPSTVSPLSIGENGGPAAGIGYNGSYYNLFEWGQTESQLTSSPGQYVIQIGTRITSVKRLYINGTAAPSAVGEQDLTNKDILIGRGAGFGITGEIAEIFVFSGSLSTTNRQLLESYLAQKWGLQQFLPSNHPNFTVPAGFVNWGANLKPYISMQASVIQPVSVPQSVLFLGDSSVGTLSTAFSTAKTALGFGPSNIQTATVQWSAGYTGSDFSNYGCVFVYTNGGLTFNSNVGNNLNNYVANGGNLIMAVFCWGNVARITNLNYSTCSTYNFIGTQTNGGISPLSILQSHPIVNGLSTNLGWVANSFQTNVSLTPNVTTLANWGSGYPAISIKTSGNSRLVGINTYPPYPYTSIPSLTQAVAKSIFWCLRLTN